MPGSNPAVSGGSPRRRSGRSHEAPGDGRPRGMAVAAFERPIGRLGGGTEPGLRAVWRRRIAAGWPHGCGYGDQSQRNRGRLSGATGDKCAFLGKTLWIKSCTVAPRSGPAKLERVWQRR